MLKKIIKNQDLDKNELDTENVEKILAKEKTYYITNRPPHYKTKVNFRVTLDYKEDHKFLNRLNYNTGNFADRSEINKFLNNNSSLSNLASKLDNDTIRFLTEFRFNNSSSGEEGHDD